MNSPNRRDFIKRSGLLLGGLFLATNKGVCHTLSAPYKGVYLDFDEAQTSIFHTGNQFGKKELFEASCTANIPRNTQQLHTGNFLASDTPDVSVTDKMNALGIQVAALGNQEISLTETGLLALAKSCPFTLVNSHMDWENPVLDKWIKPFEVVQIRNKRIGILATAGNELAKSPEHQMKVERWARNLKQFQQVDMVLSLVSQGWSKTELTSWMKTSRSINIFLCADLAGDKGGNLVLKNAEGKDTLLSFGDATGNGWSKYSCNMAMDGLVLPTQLAYMPFVKDTVIASLST